MLAVALIAAFLVEGALSLARRQTATTRAHEAFNRIADDPYRRLEARLTYGAVDRHRPASIRCKSDACLWVFSQADLARLDAAGPPPVLGFTTHVLARQTQPLHPRCARVVTRETLTQELSRILADGIGEGPRRIAS